MWHYLHTLVLFILLADIHENEARVVRKHIPQQAANSRIVGGSEAVEHNAPYAAYIVATKIHDDKTLCGGSLISKRYVLTSAHCLRNSVEVVVKLGAHNIKKKSEPSRVEFTVTKSDFKIHGRADIGTVKLPIDVNLNNHISLVTLPRKSEENVNYAGMYGIAYGWGLIKTRPEPVLPDVLHRVVVEVLPKQQCVPKKICTSGQGSKGTCDGDSGGPFMVNNVQVGVIMNGQPHCERGWRSEYVFVNKFLTWIEENSDVVIKN